MKVKFKEFFKNNFRKSPKAKIILAIVAVVSVISVVAVICLRKTITVTIDGEKKTYATWIQSVEGFFDKQGIEITSDDIVEPSLDTILSNDMDITVQKAIPVTVVIGGQEHKIMTTEKTVEGTIKGKLEYIKSLGGDFDSDDKVTPSRGTNIKKDMKIQIVRVDVEEVSETETLAYNTQVKVDYDKDINSANQVVQAGKEGSQKKAYKLYKYEDGTEEKVLQSVTVVSEPQDEIVVKGGGHFMASRSGEQIKIKGNTLTVSATAYSSNAGALTATGRRVVRDPNGISTIAVDPSVIPLGSLVYVEGYGKAVAADTGSAIKGNIIDVYLNSTSECRSWGRKHGVKVGIIAYPGEW